MSYDFDHPPAPAPDSLKWGKYRGRDVLPLWVADMDFQAPPEVIAALQARVAQGVFGYAEPTPDTVTAILGALQRDYGWQVDPEWLVPLPGLVTGLNIAARAIAEAGDELLTATPIYPPFMSSARNAGCHSLNVPLAEATPGRWTWNWERMEAAITPRTRGLFLCHPHNPTGRVWSEEELRQLVDFAERHSLTVASDEIHCELILEPGLVHQPYALLSEKAAAHSITLMAPSKTYNVPGLGAAFAIIPNATLRARFQRAMAGIVPHVNVLGFVACAAAYAHGRPWRKALLDYLRGNRDRVMQALDGKHGLRVTRPEATYLAWIDCRVTGLDNPAAFFEAAGVGLSDGRDFGMPGFVRLNFGCSRQTLDAALQRMLAALESRPS